MCSISLTDEVVSSTPPARSDGPPQPRRVSVRLGALAALAVLACGAGSPIDVVAQVADAVCTHPQSKRDDEFEILVEAHRATNRVSLRARNVPLCAVLAALTAETGLTAYGDIADARRIDVRFERQRLRRVLDHLIGDGGYLLVFPDETSGSRGSIRGLAPVGDRQALLTEASNDDATPPAATDSTDRLAREPLVDEGRARREAVESAVELDDDAATSSLASALTASDAKVRELAVETLAMLDTPHARELLHAALQDSDPDVRLEVIDTLGDLEDLRSTLALERSLADADPRVREAAADYLAERTYRARD